MALWLPTMEPLYTITAQHLIVKLSYNKENSWKIQLNICNVLYLSEVFGLSLRLPFCYIFVILFQFSVCSAIFRQAKHKHSWHSNTADGLMWIFRQADFTFPYIHTRHIWPLRCFTPWPYMTLVVSTEPPERLVYIHTDIFSCGLCLRSSNYHQHLWL